MQTAQAGEGKARDNPCFGCPCCKETSESLFSSVVLICSFGALVCLARCGEKLPLVMRGSLNANCSPFWVQEDNSGFVIPAVFLFLGDHLQKT